LTKDPYLRPGIREIMEHPWISKYKEEKLCRDNYLVRALKESEDEKDKESQEEVKLKLVKS
jgi:hypothetical protein